MDYLKLLKEHGLKVTPQRLSLLELIDNYGHIDIDTLFENIKVTFSTISLATLYKNVNSMIDKGLLSESKIIGMKTQYEIKKANHIHTICTSCNKIEDIFLNTNKIRNNLKLETNYSINQIDINFYGVCSECQKN